MSEESWLVARTKPNCEQIAIKNIKNQHFEYYYPKIKERRIKRGKVHTIEQGLFPGYLFVRTNALGHWTSLKYTYGIAGIIMSTGNSPATVSEAILEDLRRREDPLGYIVLPSPKRLVRGDKVIIKSGPFQDKIALVQRMPQKERKQVLLNLLSGKIRVLVDESELQPTE